MNESGKTYLIVLLLFSIVALAAGQSISDGEAKVTFGVG
jgi:hypothetical protein